MAYVEHKGKEDMQEDTYRILSELIIDSIMALRNKDVMTLHGDIDSIYLLVWSRMAVDRQEHFEKQLKDLGNTLYNGDERIDDLQRSLLFDELRQLLKELTGVLEEELGILLRIKADIDKLVARGHQ